MKSQKLLSTVFLLLGISTPSDQPLQAQQSPSLVAQSDRTVSTSRGGNAQSFRIESKILKETRQILVVLPVSYSQSALDRKYPITVVVDGEYLIAPVAAVSDELCRKGQIPESRFGGINFRLPDGSPPPSPAFSFIRVRK